MTLALNRTPFETDPAGQIVYPTDDGERLANDTEHMEWINFLFNGLVDWFAEREDAFIAADLLWYPQEGRPDISKSPDIMVVLNHRRGHRPSYKQWEENDRPPQVVFEFLSKSNTAAEMMDKLDFYSERGCEEYYIYDYQRGTFRAYTRPSPRGPLVKVASEGVSQWQSPILDLTFGLDSDGKLWVRRGDGLLMESHEQTVKRAAAATDRANAEAKRAELLAQKLRELGIDPDTLS